MYGMPSAAMPLTAGRITSRMIRACIAGVTTGAGEYAPMPPVFGPAVAVAQPLVVLRRRERQHVAAVDHHDEARLLAVEEILDHDARAGGAHRVVDEHRVDRGVRLGRRLRDDDALAGGEAVGLDDDRRAALARRRRAPRAASVNVAVARGRDAVPRHERLGEILRALELRRRRVGPKIRRPAARNASTMPAASGASGPTTVSAICCSGANATRSAIAVSATLVSPGSRAVPALPGATNTLATRGDCAIFHASACSRPPPPMTRMFIAPLSIERDLAEDVQDAAVVDAAAERRDVRA